MNRALALGLLLTLLASCAPAPVEPVRAPQGLPDFPYPAYRPAPGATVYKVDNERTRVDILVRRGGTLARFGHDHVVSARPSEGFILLNAGDYAGSRADVRFALDSLVVDDPSRREQYALDTQPTAQDIEGTAANMHGKVLQTAAWPLAHAGVEIKGGAGGVAEALLTLYLHGKEHAFPVTVNLEEPGEGHLLVSGTCRLRQSDYGIQPFSILGGGLQVLDELEVSFTLQADRVLYPANYSG